jgi:hypothetical protein
MVEKGLQFSRRKNVGGSNFYFIANRSNKKMEDWVTLQTKANSAALYNPMNGQSGVAQFRKNEKGFLEVYLQLNTDESYIVQTSNKILTGLAYPYIKKKTSSNEITGKWTLSFTAGGPRLPDAVSLDQLKPWTELDGDAFTTFSGTAFYSVHFKKPSGSSSRYLLNLGKVYESAQVFMNGKMIATLVGPDYETTIAAKDLKDDNLLEIGVSNSMANRIIDLDKRNVFWKRFNNTNFPARMGQNRGADGLFNASKWEPRKSGLAGPATLTAIETVY